MPGNTYRGHRFWPGFRQLIDNPVVLPILQELLGDPAWGHAPAGLPHSLRPRIRLDHDNVHHRPPHKQGDRLEGRKARWPCRRTPESWPHTFALHGGPSSWHITCVFELRSVGPGEGGFGAAAGSHTMQGREALETMGLETDEWKREWVDTEWTRKHPDWDDAAAPIHRVEGQSGDCILFTGARKSMELADSRVGTPRSELDLHAWSTEKMVHGTIPWSGKGERRTVFHSAQRRTMSLDQL